MCSNTSLNFYGLRKFSSVDNSNGNSQQILEGKKGDRIKTVIFEAQKLYLMLKSLRDSFEILVIDPNLQFFEVCNC